MNELLDLCEGLDAAIFSGDSLQIASLVELAEFDNYLNRWKRAAEERLRDITASSEQS